MTATSPLPAMTPTLLFLGSIGVVSETSDLQREAYNRSLKEHGLGWHWSPEVYRQLLRSSGGLDRLELLAAATGVALSAETAASIHARKTEIACAAIRERQVGLRPGVAALVRAARGAGARVGWVTSTSGANTDAILDASGGDLAAADFDRIFHRGDVLRGKPDPQIYTVALAHFGATADQAVAVEDSLTSVLSARRAGVFTVATPGEFHSEPMAGVADAVYASSADLPLGEWFA